MDADPTKSPRKEAAGPTDVNTGGGAFVGGSVTAGGDFVGRDKVTIQMAASAADADFRKLEQAIEARPDTPPEDKADLHAAVQDMHTEAAKGAQADQGFIERQLRIIGRMAPDILEVAVATFANPGVGLALVAKKITEKAQPHDAK